MRDEGLGAPVDVAAEGLAGCGVGGREGVVDEGGAHGGGGFDGLGDEAAAEGEGGLVADAGGAFGEEDDGEAVAEALGHAFGGLGGGATLAAGDVAGSGHHGHPAEDGGLAESAGEVVLEPGGACASVTIRGQKSCEGGDQCRQKDNKQSVHREDRSTNRNVKKAREQCLEECAPLESSGYQ